MIAFLLVWVFLLTAACGRLWLTVRSLREEIGTIRDDMPRKTLRMP